MWYVPILNFIWNYKFLISSIILLIILLLVLNDKKVDKINFEKELQNIELKNSKQKHLLLNKARDLERNLNSQLIENSKIKREKDEEVQELNSTIVSNSGRLQQLLQESAAANKYNCKDTTTPKVIERIIRVPSPEEPQEAPRKVDSNTPIEMFTDFEKLSATCAFNYEKLKSESKELEGWAEAVMSNSSIE